MPKAMTTGAGENPTADAVVVTVVHEFSSMAVQDQEDGTLGADLPGVDRRKSVEGVLGVGAEGAEASGEVRFAVLQAPQIGGEPCEVAPRGAVVALGLLGLFSRNWLTGAARVGTPFPGSGCRGWRARPWWSVS
jgi:hypothetical protein